MRAAGNIYAIGVKPNGTTQDGGIRVRMIFCRAETSHPTPKAGTNKTIGEQPGWETQMGNG
jgi:hypothetical protein